MVENWKEHGKFKIYTASVFLLKGTISFYSVCMIFYRQQFYIGKPKESEHTLFLL